MSHLYTLLAEVYDGMYRTFINYDDEFKFYSKILEANHCKHVLEIGCGTGNLAGRFIENNFNYTGLDLSEEMLTLARKHYPQGEFVKGDMRTFSFPHEIESVMITGRTISYLVTNKDVYDSLANIKSHLKSGGLLCFDCIDASKFIPMIRRDEKVIHKASFNDRAFVRESFWNVNLAQSWTFDWLSVYYEDQGGQLNKIGEDTSTIRAFTKDEIQLFLRLTGYDVIEIIDRASYAFDTFVVVAATSK